MSLVSVPPELVKDVIDQNLEAVPRWNGRRLRAQHVRSLGCVAATFQVRENLPERMRYGLFAQPGIFDAALRFSNGAHYDDRDPDVHGMAVKLFDVPGPKLIDKEALTHLGIAQFSDDFDFVLTDQDTFPSYEPNEYERLNRLVAAGQALHHALNKRRGWSLRVIKEGLRAALRVLLTKEGKRHRRMAFEFASNYMHSPFAVHFWSTTPYRLGPELTVRYLARSVRPDIPTRPVDEPDGISQHLRRDVADGENRFEFCVIEPPRTDDGFDLLDNRIRWACDPHNDAPLNPHHPTVTPVADITIAHEATFDPHDGDAFSFSPWRVTAEHKPLGPINAIRLGTYLSLAKARFPNR